MRRQLTNEEKEIIGLKCCNCGSETDLEYHHIIPLALGGFNKLSNMCCLCYQCHSLLHFGTKKNINHSEATKKGLQKAKERGVILGLPKGTKLTTKKSLDAKEKIKQLNYSFEGTLNNEETYKQIGISRNTFYKYKKELLQSNGLKIKSGEIKK